MKQILPMMFMAFLMLPDAGEGKLLRAGTCGGCHIRSFDGWQTSGHAKSVSSEEFRLSLKRYLLKAGRDDGSFCFRCHAPAILITGEAFTATEEILRGRGSREGVTCIVCHSVESVKGGIAKYDPGDISAYHRVKDLESIDRQALCSSCHRDYGSFENDTSVEADKKGFFRKIALIFGDIINKGSKKEVDHSFRESAPGHDKAWKCPGLEGLEEK